MTLRGLRGGAPDRPVREALLRELGETGDETDRNADGRRVAKIDLVARALIDKAIGGDAAAIKEIFDRVDGRAGTTEPAGRRAITLEEALDQLDAARPRRAGEAAHAGRAREDDSHTT
jgi:hypothetical protein